MLLFCMSGTDKILISNFVFKAHYIYVLQIVLWFVMESYFYFNVLGVM